MNHPKIWERQKLELGKRTIEWSGGVLECWQSNRHLPNTLTRLVKREGALVFVADGVKIEPEAIGAAVAEERVSR